MARGRLVVEPINDEKARKVSFLKRKKGLIKKAYEISTLCGVDVCLIIYGPEPNAQPEIWPEDPSVVRCIIEKYRAKITERRPKHYDVKDFFKDRMNKVEAEIMKTRKDCLKLLYPTWDERFNTLEEGTLRNFISNLDEKIDACNQRINMLKRNSYIKEKEAEMAIPPYMDSNRSHLNLIAHNMMSQAQFSPVPMKPLGDNNQLALYRYQLGKNSQSIPQFDQNLMQLMAMNNGIVDVGAINCDPKTAVVGDEVENNQNSSLCYYNGNVQSMQPIRECPPLQTHLTQSMAMNNGIVDVGAINCDPRTAVVVEDEIENNQNSSLCYYNGNVQTVQPIRECPQLQTLPPQNMQYQAALQNLPPLPPGFQMEEYYRMLQAQMFNHMNARK